MSWRRSCSAVGMSRVWLTVGLVFSLTAALLMGSAAPGGAVAGYGDVGESSWYTNAVQWSVDNAITDISGACFAPETPVSRGETAVWIYNMENQPDAGDRHPFTDVTDSSQDDAISWMANNEITTGTSPTTFAPDDTLRRAQVAAFLHRLAGEPSAPPHGFVDVVAGWQQGGVSWMSHRGITTGTSPTTFAPEDTLTRAHLVTFLYRYKNEPEVTLNTSTPDCDPTADVDEDQTQPDLTVAVESSAPSVVRGAFDVTITFSAPVTDFELDDISVVNGAATSLAGTGAGYTATIEPAADGTVVVRVPESRVQGPRSVPNASSALFVRTQAQSTGTARLGLDTWDRSVVLGHYRQEFEREEPGWVYTGDVDECVAGTTSQDFRDSVLRRVNWYRRMAGLATVAEDPALTATAQRKALIMLAQGALSHTPSPDWACYTDIDYPGENIGLGAAGVRGVDGYMQDSGDSNQAVGHRLQILSPLVVGIGTGNVRDGDRRYGVANAMHLDYDFSLVPAARELRGFVAWPPPGYVPAPTVWGRWSFSMQRIEMETSRVGNTTYTRWFLSGPDFSSASVALSDDNGPVATEIIHRDGALVWAVNGDTRSAPLPEPADDHCYTVTISGVRVGGTLQVPYEYAVCVLGPER